MTKKRTGLGVAVVCVVAALSSGNAAAQGRANWWQRISAPYLGCRPTEVRVSEREDDNGVDSWLATCRGQTMTCAWVRGSSFHCAPLR